MTPQDHDRIRQIAEAFCDGAPGRSIAVAGSQPAPAFFGVNEDIPRPCASVIKVAAVMALFDLAAAGTLSLDESIPLHSLGHTRYCSILKAFDTERSLSLKEISALSLITSDNPATTAVMARLGYEDINAVLKAAGCSDHARCAAGFSEAELGPANRANQLTARDTVRLFQHLAAVPRYRPIITFLENNLRNARIPALLPEDAVIAHKTGSLEGVVNDAGIISCAGTSFILAFLCDGQTDPITTQNDIADCSKQVFDAVMASP